MRPVRVLVAEDNAINRQVALAQLRKLGYEALAVDNGAKPSKRVQAGGYDLMLMDCQMPVIDGLEATRLIRQTTDIPIVAMTAHAMPGDRERCLSEGMDDYLAKPVELKQLAEVLAKWIPGRDRGSPRYRGMEVKRNVSSQGIDATRKDWKRTSDDQS